MPSMAGWRAVAALVSVAMACTWAGVAGHDHHHAGKAHQCVHDYITTAFADSPPPPPARQLYAHEAGVGADGDTPATDHGRRTQTVYSPIRITADTSLVEANADPGFSCYAAGQQYQPSLAQRSTDRSTCQTADVLTPEKRTYLINTIIPAAISFFQDSLSVVPVAGNLVLPNPIPTSTCCNDAWGVCNTFVCCANQFPNPDRTVGVANTDFRMYVTARPAGGGTIAWALTCQSDQYSRPVAGHINFNPSRVSTLPEDFPSQLSTAVHELMHALGFSSSTFPRWRRPGTNDQEAYFNIVWSGSERGNTIKKIITPNVVTAMKAHFNCFSWSSATAGMELEDFGGSGTAGSHWEKRLLMNEVMTGTADPNSVYSAITFAAFADMGWYQVSQTRVQRLPWGNGQGCSFVQDTCNNWNSRYFCTVPNQGGCTPDMRYRALCNVFDAPYTLPSQFQYFNDVPGRGGQNAYVDYCPVYWRLSNGDCQSATTTALWFYGEQVGANARCFSGTYQRSSIANTPAQHGGCLETSCTVSNLLQVKLVQSGGGRLTVVCPRLGGDVNLATLPGSEYTGVLNCPPADVMCTGNPCDSNNCNGRGTCSPADGTCTCQSGYYGETIYDCAKRYCPMGRLPNGTLLECAGNAACNSVLGRCEDETGQPGCYSGWTDSGALTAGGDGACARRGCPIRTSTACNGTAACECAGHGNCTMAGTCSCFAGFIGNDCSVTDCPFAGGQRCSGSTAGTCDGSRGYCECTEGFDDVAQPLHFVGAACNTRLNATRRYEPLYFNGEVNPANNVTGAPLTGVLLSKEYTYFRFEVPSTLFPLTLSLKLDGRAAINPLVDANATFDDDGDGWESPRERAARYFNQGLNALNGMPTQPILVASYATMGKPTARSNQFTPSSVDDSTRQYDIVFQRSGTEGQFTQSGTMYVAVLSPVDAFFTLTLSRDGCALINCTRGTCSNGQCQCPRYRESERPSIFYGWAGPVCDVPDCPGQPDCGGNRGTCTVPLPGDANHPDGRPYCSCNGLYGGESCNSYALPSSTQVLGLGVGSSPLVLIPVTTFNQDGTNTTTTTRVYNVTLTGTLDLGLNESRIMVDPSALASCCGMNGTITVYARLDTSASPLADGMMFGQRNAIPTLRVYSHFDEGAWRAKRPRQEFVASVTPNNLFFVSVFNSRYGTDALQYTLYVEAVTDGCAPSLNGCSGHGACSSNGECACDLGYEGLRCDVVVPVLPSGSQVTINNILPGGVAYWVHPISDSPETTVEITVNMTRTGSPRSIPILTAAFDSIRSANSLPALTSEVAVYDYASYRNGTGVQSFLIRRTSLASQRFLYLGLHNTAFARAALSATVSLQAQSSSSLPTCTGANNTCRRQHCFDHGNYITLNGQPFCQCDFGWNPDSRCGSPLFSTFSHLAEAGQRIGFLCSVCEVQNITLDREGAVLYKIPQPLQKSTGLRLDVGPQAFAAAARAAPRLLGADADVLGELSAAGRPNRLVSDYWDDMPEPERQWRRLQVSAGNGTDSGLTNPDAIGNPSLLVSTTMPRSILDFFYISSSSSENETLAIDTPSPTGQYWVAIYANTPGNFRIGATRFSYAVNSPAGPDFGARLAAWLVQSTAGIIVLAFAGVLMLCVCGGCMLQACVGKVCCRHPPKPGEDAAAASKAGDADGLQEMKRAALLKTVRTMTTRSERVDGPGGSSGVAAEGSGVAGKIRVLTSSSFRMVGGKPAPEPAAHNLGSALIAAAQAAAHHPRPEGGAGASKRSLHLRTPSGAKVPGVANPLLSRNPSAGGAPPIVAVAGAGGGFALPAFTAVPGTAVAVGSQSPPVSGMSPNPTAPTRPPGMAGAGTGYGAPMGMPMGMGSPRPIMPGGGPIAFLPQFTVGGVGTPLGGAGGPRGPMMLSPTMAGGMAGGGGHAYNPSAFSLGTTPMVGSAGWSAAGDGPRPQPYVLLDASQLPSGPPPRPMASPMPVGGGGMVPLFRPANGRPDAASSPMAPNPVNNNNDARVHEL